MDGQQWVVNIIESCTDSKHVLTVTIQDNTKFRESDFDTLKVFEYIVLGKTLGPKRNQVVGG